MCGIHVSIAVRTVPKGHDAIQSNGIIGNRVSDLGVASSDPFMEEIHARGPDFQSTHTISLQIPTSSSPNSPLSHRPAHNVDINFTSSVLALRGLAKRGIVRQPLRGNRGVLCWNGQIFQGLGLEGQESDIEKNDTEALMAELEKGDRKVEEILGEVEGPYAFVYWEEASDTIFFGRDVFGRRSLLCGTSGDLDNGTSVFHIASINIDQSVEGITSATSDMKEVNCGNLWSLDTNRLREFHEGGDIPWHSFLQPVLRDTGGSTSKVFTAIPRINSEIPEIQSNKSTTADDCSESSRPEPSDTSKSLFVSSLRSSIRQRVSNIPPPSSAGQARLAILFSGGIDCTFLTHLASEFIPMGEPIDLLNVAFENPRAIQAAKKVEEDQARVKAKNAKKAKDNHRSVVTGSESPGCGQSLAQGNISSSCKGIVEEREVYGVPDRLTGREAVDELRSLHPEWEWRFVEIDVTYAQVQAAKKKVQKLMFPSDTEMDMSLALPLYFAAQRRGRVRSSNASIDWEDYESAAKVVLSGLGADELLGGYARHRREYQLRGWQGVIDELQLDLDRLPTRNLGRDDRIISSQGIETRFPYLSLDFVHKIATELSVREKCDLSFGEGVGDKSLIRRCCQDAGLNLAATRKKRAMQFGTRSARMEEEAPGSKGKGMGARKLEG